MFVLFLFRELSQRGSRAQSESGASRSGDSVFGVGLSLLELLAYNLIFILLPSQRLPTDLWTTGFEALIILFVGILDSDRHPRRVRFSPGSPNDLITTGPHHG